MHRTQTFALALGFLTPLTPVAGQRALDAEARSRVIEQAIQRLEDHYVFPEVATRMGAALRERQRRGEYDSVTGGPAFAALLTEHLRGVSRDRHLRVHFAADRDRGAGSASAPDGDRRRQLLLDNNCGFERAERLDGNVGYVRFTLFAEPDICGETASRALAGLAGVRALIIDLRGNGGGHPAMVAHISSYLFSTRVHLNDIWERRSGETRHFYTNPSVPGAKIGDDVPVYVLTSARTFSGAEEFSYNLKHLKRATIVGETTGGGAHPVSPHPIGDGFVIGVPFARAINPVTKTNWEGTGVEPDVKVPASGALETALRLISERRTP